MYGEQNCLGQTLHMHSVLHLLAVEMQSECVYPLKIIVFESHLDRMANNVGGYSIHEFMHDLL